TTLRSGRSQWPTARPAGTTSEASRPAREGATRLPAAQVRRVAGPLHATSLAGVAHLPPTTVGAVPAGARLAPRRHPAAGRQHGPSGVLRLASLGRVGAGPSSTPPPWSSRGESGGGGCEVTPFAGVHDAPASPARASVFARVFARQADSPALHPATRRK